MGGTIVVAARHRPMEPIKVLPQPVPRRTADDYLRWEAEQPDKHEYERGETFAMGDTAGGPVISAGRPCQRKR